MAAVEQQSALQNRAFAISYLCWLACIGSEGERHRERRGSWRNCHLPHLIIMASRGALLYVARLLQAK